MHITGAGQQQRILRIPLRQRGVARRAGGLNRDKKPLFDREVMRAVWVAITSPPSRSNASSRRTLQS